MSWGVNIVPDRSGQSQRKYSHLAVTKPTVCSQTHNRLGASFAIHHHLPSYEWGTGLSPKYWIIPENCQKIYFSKHLEVGDWAGTKAWDTFKWRLTDGSGEPHSVGGTHSGEPHIRETVWTTTGEGKPRNPGTQRSATLLTSCMRLDSSKHHHHIFRIILKPTNEFSISVKFVINIWGLFSIGQVASNIKWANTGKAFRD